MNQYTRKTDFIDRQVQGELARRLVIHWLFFLGTMAGLVLGTQWIDAPFRPFGEQIALAWERYGLIFIALVCSIPISVIDSIRLSNRFSGPILRFRRAAQDLAEGNTPEKITLRNDDFWQDLAGDLNRIIERQEGSNTTSS